MLVLNMDINFRFPISETTCGIASAGKTIYFISCYYYRISLTSNYVQNLQKN